MAAIDYFAQEEAIQAHLLADAALSGVPVLVETELTVERKKGVIITLERRDAEPSQAIAAGTRTLYRIRFSLICVGWAETLKAAAQQRDDLLGAVEVALMNNRDSLTASIGSYYLEGGEFEVGRDSGFMAAATIILIAMKRTTT